MTAPARIRQDDMERAVKVATKYGCGKVSLDPATGRIEIVLGESAPAPVGDNWDDTDV